MSSLDRGVVAERRELEPGPAGLERNRIAVYIHKPEEMLERRTDPRPPDLHPVAVDARRPAANHIDQYARRAKGVFREIAPVGRVVGDVEHDDVRRAYLFSGGFPAGATCAAPFACR